MSHLWWFLPAAAGFSFALTALLRRYALARSLVDVPNGRSSHVVPTPRGGGVAIVASFVGGLPLLAHLGVLPWPVFWALAGAGGLVAAIGFLDDHGHVRARWRLLAHFAAALWALAWLGGAPPLAILGASYDLGAWGFALAAVYLVWLLNLYNFMDGIDGIAGIEAIAVCLGAGVLYVVSGQPALAATPALLAVAVAGFLCWNFPPAKIFMGDAGSGFLGMVLGVLSLQAGAVAAELLWAWLILLGVFVVDATWTLVTRLGRGEKVYEAHRSHAYQHASRHFGRHLPVTLAVGVIDLCWLLPLALLVGCRVLDGLIGTLLAYSPLVVLAVKFRAGQAEPSRARPVRTEG